MPEPDPDEDRIYWSFHEGGVELLTSLEAVIEAIFLYREGHEGFSEYRGPLPFGLRLNQKQASFREILGPPTFDAPSRVIPPLLGRKGPMERYDFASFSLHVQYAEMEDEVLVVTLMLPSRVPAKEIH